MYQLFETIKVKDNQLQNLDYHNQRVNYSRSELFGARDDWELSGLIEVPELDRNRVYRCRFNYAREAEGIEFIPYTPRVIQKLFLASADELDYRFKYADRRILEDLRKKYAIEEHSDILIVKNELISDVSFANIAFYDGSGWFTPDSPLLKGTKRARYLQEGILKEAHIKVADLEAFRKARLINAMLDLETGSDIDISNIRAF